MPVSRSIRRELRQLNTSLAHVVVRCYSSYTSRRCKSNLAQYVETWAGRADDICDAQAAPEVASRSFRETSSKQAAMTTNAAVSDAAEARTDKQALIAFQATIIDVDNAITTTTRSSTSWKEWSTAARYFNRNVIDTDRSVNIAPTRYNERVHCATDHQSRLPM